MNPSFERPVRIRFSHCDPAGIVYFPQYLVMTNVLVEDWFNEGLRIDYARMIGQRRIGLPIVKLDCEFVRPSQMGETMLLALGVDTIGRSSLGIEFHGHCNGETRFRSQQKLVFMSFDTGKSIDIPGDIASALAAFAPPSPSTEAHRP
ncbi:acyl-CoA thioesterase [Paraburkholderia sp. ZP32-5]|uniref:acyl-CoA thioesterase n=1 Tax=Paraburkholderia sp. ZP32-5 TaxID=2883245 RepID=UPI001F169534|nr:thioesterase family protein [Paraburkholderia sp. ZP32-5]